MHSKILFWGSLCLAGALAVACGTEDDSAGTPSGGANGTAGRGTAGHGTGGGLANGGSAGVGPTGGGANGGDAGEAGMGGAAPTCTQLSDLVHGLIKNDTTSKTVPTPVNDIVFCADPADPAAYKDLF